MAISTFFPFLPGGTAATSQADATTFVPSSDFLLLPDIQARKWPGKQLSLR